MIKSGKLLGIVGSYRRDGIIDSAVSEVLKGAGDRGAEAEKIYLLDYQIEFCRNCRSCMQEPGNDRRAAGSPLRSRLPCARRRDRLPR